MKKTWLRRASVIVLALVVTIVTGCQSLSGLDLNKVLKNSVKVTSLESKSTLELQLELDEEVLADYDESEADMYRLLSNVKLNLDHIAVQDELNMSLEGSIVFGDANLPFDLSLSETAMVLNLEGMEAPIVFELIDEYMLEEGDVQDEEKLAEIGRQITDLVSGYAIDKLPNPSGLTAVPVTETIGGTPTSAMKVSFEMDGVKLIDWVKSYLTALTDNRDELAAVIEKVLELLDQNPVYWESLEMMNPFESDVLDAPTVGDMANQAADEIIALIEPLQEELLFSEEEGQALSEMLNLRGDVYIDYGLNIRKQDWEFNYKYVPSILDEVELEDEEYYEEPNFFTGMTIKSTSEQWNVGGAVKAKEAVTPDNALAAEDLEYLGGYDFLKHVDKKSDLYDLLTNKLHITRQTYSAYSDDYYNPPIILPNYHTIVAIRDVADAFDATTKYHAPTRQISVYDEITDTRIVVKVGSNIVKVNGVEQEWPVAVTSIDGYTYVPARKLAEALGADIKWETVYEDWQMLTITREP
ncbi:copper amine oxidase N-terminal domain-containing protein [Paenibacillus sp. strain BS8-2]